MSREPITMPVLSDTMSTGRLVNWLKKPGDPVKKGEVIAEVESDKAIMDVEAFEDGYLAGPLAPPDSEIPVGEVIGYLSDTEESPETASESTPSAEALATRAPSGSASTREVVTTQMSHTPSRPNPPAAPSSAPARKEALSPPAPGIQASPYARGLARELGIDLAQVAPGADGVIHGPQVVAAALRGPQPDLDAGPPYRIEPLTTMQRAVAENMSATLTTPSFRVSARLSLEPLMKAAREHEHSTTLLLAMACARAVREHPRFNAVYTPMGLAMRERVDVGIAVDIPNGLVTPVIRDAANRPLDELAEEWRILKDKVKRRRLSHEDYTGATFYLSNLGPFAVVTRFDALVPQGAAAILALGAEHQGQAEFTLSCDHRVVFGADAARFMETLAAQLRDTARLKG